MQKELLQIHDLLFDRFGPQNWWPGDSPLEVIIGAVLTQNTNWNNVAKAIDNLKQENLLLFQTIIDLPVEVLADRIRPSGYYNQKAKRLKNLFAIIAEANSANPGNNSIAAFFDCNLSTLREKLLHIKGIGPETADSIILYSAEKPVFVVDAYTYRILFRHGLIPEDAGYDEIQDLFMDNLEADVKLYNEYHALLVRTGKEFCKKSKPRCDDCPLTVLF